MKRKIKAFILDLDGVITDTAEYHYQAWKCLASEEGIEFSRQDNEKLRGVSRRKSLEIILGNRQISEENKKEMMERKNNYYQQYISKMTRDDLLPGSEELLKTINENNFKIAVASSSKNAKTVIDNLEIKDLFDVIADGYSVDNPKPEPDIFLYTAEQLEVEPTKCVVIEDAKAGIEAALAAEMVAVGIGPANRVGKADYRYEHVKDIKLEQIIKADDLV